MNEPHILKLLQNEKADNKSHNDKRINNRIHLPRTLHPCGRIHHPAALRVYAEGSLLLHRVLGNGRPPYLGRPVAGRGKENDWRHTG